MAGVAGDDGQRAWRQPELAVEPVNAETGRGERWLVGEVAHPVEPADRHFLGRLEAARHFLGAVLHEDVVEVFGVLGVVDEAAPCRAEQGDQVGAQCHARIIAIRGEDEPLDLGQQFPRVTQILVPLLVDGVVTGLCGGSIGDRDGPPSELERGHRVPLALANHHRLLARLQQAIPVPESQGRTLVHSVALVAGQPPLVVDE